MKSTISPSLFPAAICSRICRRKSTASSAFDSAIDWFWQTRQRSSLARCTARVAATGSFSVGTASPARAASGAAARSNTQKPRRQAAQSQRRSSNFIWGCLRLSCFLCVKCLRLLQFTDQRQDLLLERIARHGPDVLLADRAGLVDHESLWHAVNAVFDADAPVRVGHRQQVGVAETAQPRLGFVGLVLVVEADDRHGLGARQLGEQRMLVATGNAPRRPDVEQPHLAQHVLARELLLRRVELREAERRRGLADQRRGHLARVEAEPREEEADEGGENRQRDKIPVHYRAAAAPGTVSARVERTR